MATVDQLRQAARKAGFRGPALLVAVAIALAESGGDEKAVNHNTDGSTDMGAWQINSIHTDLLTGKNPYDLQQNAAMAYTLYKRAGSFRDWTTARTIDGKPPAYEQHLTAAAGLQRSGGHKHQGTLLGSATLGNAVSVADDVADKVNPINNIDDLARALGSVALWRRIGIGFLAFLLLLIGFIIMIESNKNVRAATTDAVKVAAL